VSSRPAGQKDAQRRLELQTMRFRCEVWKFFNLDLDFKCVKFYYLRFWHENCDGELTADLVWWPSDNNVYELYKGKFKFLEDASHFD